MWHVMGVCCRCAACSKSPAGEGCQNSLVLFSLLSIFNYASFDNCRGIPGAPVVSSLQRMTGICLINQRSVHSACYQQATAQHRANLLVSWDARPFPDSDANLVSSGVIFSAALFSKVHLNLPSQYQLKKHQWWPSSTDGTEAHAYPPVEGMISR